MAWLMRGKVKNKKPQTKQRQLKRTALNADTVFDLDLSSASASHQSGVIIMGFLCQLSERFLRVLAQHENNAALMGTPVSFTGA